MLLRPEASTRRAGNADEREYIARRNIIRSTAANWGRSDNSTSVKNNKTRGTVTFVIREGNKREKKTIAAHLRRRTENIKNIKYFHRDAV